MLAIDRPALPVSGSGPVGHALWSKFVLCLVAQSAEVIALMPGSPLGLALSALHQAVSHWTARDPPLGHFADPARKPCRAW